VIGSGPTGVFAYHFLRRAGVDAVLFGNYTDASIVPVNTPDGPITLVPVFPVLPAPAFPPSSRCDEPLAVCRSGNSSWTTSARPAMKSLVATLIPDADAAAMAIKQFGEAAYREPHHQVQQKIARAYGAVHAVRAGYLNGVSPYLGPMTSILHSAEPAPRRVGSWRPLDHLLTLTVPNEAVAYEKLVYAGGLDHLLVKLGLNHPPPPRTPARFSVWRSDKALAPNRVVYDLNENSDVFRSFVVREHIVVVQESLKSSEASSRPESITKPLGALFDASFNSVCQPLVYRSAYPVETLSVSIESIEDRVCENLGILRFGRNATSRYLDLHELPWNELATWAST
jgi:hypothetical protein